MAVSYIVQCALCTRLSLLLYRDGPTMVSTCNKLQEPDDVTLGAVVGNTCCSCVSIVLVHACIRVVGERENVQDKAVSSSWCRSFWGSETRNIGRPSQGKPITLLSIRGSLSIRRLLSLMAVVSCATIRNWNLTQLKYQALDSTMREILQGIIISNATLWYDAFYVDRFFSLHCYLHPKEQLCNKIWYSYIHIFIDHSLETTQATLSIEACRVINY